MTLLDLNAGREGFCWEYQINDPHIPEGHRKGMSWVNSSEALKFAKSGAMVVREVFTNRQICDFLSAIDRIRQKKLSLPASRPKKSQSYPGIYLRDIHKSSIDFHSVIRHELLTGTIRHLIGPKVRLRAFSARITSEVSQTKWHQDQRSSNLPDPPLWSPPNDISVLIYLTPSNQKTGHFEFIPGSHKGYHSLSRDEEFEPHLDSQGIVCQPGDVIVAHSSLFHRANLGRINNSIDQERVLFILHFGPSYYTPQIYSDNKTLGLDQSLIDQAISDKDFELLELLTYTGAM